MLFKRLVLSGVWHSGQTIHKGESKHYDSFDVVVAQDIVLQSTAWDSTAENVEVLISHETVVSEDEYGYKHDLKKVTVNINNSSKACTAIAGLRVDKFPHKCDGIRHVHVVAGTRDGYCPALSIVAVGASLSAKRGDNATFNGKCFK